MAVADTLQNAGVGVDVATTLDDLSAIHLPGRAATIWQRAEAISFTSWLGALEPSQLPKTRLILRPEKVRDALDQLFWAAGLPDEPERLALRDDIVNLCETFSGLMNAPYLRVRLDVVTTNACKKFHIDAVTARLICTYRGTGTQYGISSDGTEPKQIYTVPTGVPLVLRGTLWPETPKSGLLHRSPPIFGTGETRLVLVLDPIFDLEAEN